MPLTRRLILQKARHHTTKDALTDCKHTVSGTISLPSRGTFHHSLTVLFTIGHTKYLGLHSGLCRFTRDFTSPVLLGNTTKRQQDFSYRTLTHYGLASQLVHLSHHLITFYHLVGDDQWLPQPRICNARRLSHTPGLTSSAFARHYSQNISS